MPFYLCGISPALVEVMMSTVFPATYSDTSELYAISLPFKYDYIFSSSLFKMAFLDENGQMKVRPTEVIGKKITNEKKEAAYRIILHKFYGFDFGGSTFSVQPFNDPSTGLTRHLELKIDPQFIDVKALRDLPAHDFGETKHKTTDVLKIPHLLELLPLEMFEFEGIAIIHITDVTDREVISEIKNELLNIHSFVDADGFNKLQLQMRNLLGLPDVQIGLTPFFKVNEHYIFAEQYYKNSILLKFNRTAECLSWASWPVNWQNADNFWFS